MILAGIGMRQRDFKGDVNIGGAPHGGPWVRGWHAIAPTERTLVIGTVFGTIAGIVAVVMSGRLMTFLGWFAIIDFFVFGACLKLETANAAWHVQMMNLRRGSVERLPYDLIIGFNCLVWISLIASVVWYFTSERKLGLVMSPTQKEFVQIVGEFRKRFNAPYSNGDALFKERDNKLCQLSQAREPMAWTGIARIGRRGFKVEIEQQVFLDGGFSKSYPASEQNVESLKDGDKVFVTGWLNGGRKSCVSERSITNAGSFMDPDFEFTFATIRKM